ncbi:hypothetical protein TELCIR_25002 [Teladorsagia circumcincta]|uniref:Uncharacterized protein n=1 Tax=Teladorsagia circumcincta TaxID=45464 RepID=A0A2G9T6R9_TELCI|nr:hypothetical protein TELCIR_25002 [Teladorsagia circumcincta]
MGEAGQTEGGVESKKPQVLPARTPGQTVLGQFALRPGDDVDLSSERATTIGSAEGGAPEV